MNIKIKFGNEDDIESIKKVSTENLILWIIGKSEEEKIKLNMEDIVLQCWVINPEKHSLRGYPQYPDSAVVMKRIPEMSRKKGLLVGNTTAGYKLSELGKQKFRILLIENKIKTKNKTDRTVSSMDEAPYKKLIKTPAYLKFRNGLQEQIVETDFLYFYGVNWHNKSSVIQGKIKNVNLIINTFGSKDALLKEVADFLNLKFEKTIKSLLHEK